MQATDNDVDTLYARPEVADCFCPVRVKTRLAKLLAEDSPLVYRSPEATIWLGHGGFILFYAAESVAALERELPRALEKLAPLGREAGAVRAEVFVTSQAAAEVFARNGYELSYDMKRMFHDAPGPRPADARVRPTTDGDRHHLVKVAMKVFPEDSRSEEEWTRSFANLPPGWLAFVDGQPVGFLNADLTADAIFIMGLGVDPELRRQGLASALVDRALEAAVEHERPRVVVYANDTAEAIGFYLRAGFQTERQGWHMNRSW